MSKCVKARKCLISIGFVILVGFGNPFAALATCISIASPASNSVVSGGSIPIHTTDTCSGMWFEGMEVDGAPAGAFVAGQGVFNSTIRSNGNHTITITSQSENPGTVVLGSASITVNVQNSVASTGSSSSSCMSVQAPLNGTVVSGNAIAIKTYDICKGVWFEGMKIDGTPSGTFQTEKVMFKSTRVGNGNHVITVTSQSANPGSIVLGSASITLNVQNGAGALPTTTPTATPTPAHYSTLGPGATLPSESACAAAVNAWPTQENAPWNDNDGTGYNSNKPPAGGVPSYFYDNVPCCHIMPNADFQKVDGAYTGTTESIFRVYACKWGVDEDYIRAQAWMESGWHQDCPVAHGGTGCYETGDYNHPGGCTTGVPTTSISPGGQFCALEGFGGVASPNGYASWSMLKTKVHYNWMTWPMIEESTPFAVDFLLAETRGCINGDKFEYFNDQNPTAAADYQNAVNAARTNPKGASRMSGWTNLQYLAYGCIDAHYLGAWYNGASDSYIAEFTNAVNEAPWPGGIK